MTNGSAPIAEINTFCHPWNYLSSIGKEAQVSFVGVAYFSNFPSEKAFPTFSPIFK